MFGLPTRLRAAVLVLCVVATALAATVAVSRMYLGTHFLSDTLFGIALGVAAFAVGRWLAPRVRTHLPASE
jgi:undecaprenyl-diphosphatase